MKQSSLKANIILMKQSSLKANSIIKQQVSGSHPGSRENVIMCLRKFQGYGTGMVVQDKKRFLCKIKIKSISCWMFD